MAQPPKVGFRFAFGGVNLTSVPDSLPPEKFASAQNIRAYSPQAIRTRPGYSLDFHCGNNAITDIQSYTALGTDNLPRYLARDSDGNVWLSPTSGNNATNVGNLAGPQGAGVSSIPWRPTQSPQTWLYMAGQNDYQKFSAPDANNNVTQFKVGIAEPQIAVDAAPLQPFFIDFTGNASNWTASGTAGNASNGNIISDTTGTPLSDPALSSRLSVPVTIPYYMINSLIWCNNTANNVSLLTEFQVQDVIPPVANTSIQAIRYQSGNNGNCVVVCYPLPIGQGPTSPTIMGSLRRGAILNIGNNSSNENVFVQSATEGPNGSIQFVTSTNSTRAANDSITGVRAIVIDRGNANLVNSGQAITQPAVDSTIGATSGTVNTSGQAVTWVSGVQFQTSFVGATIIINSVAYQVAAVIDATHLQVTSSAGNQSGVAYSVPSVGGVGTLTRTLSPNPFTSQYIGGGGLLPTPDDYIRLVVLLNNIADFVELDVVFVCGTYGTFAYTADSLQITAGELAIIEFPISSLTQGTGTTDTAENSTPVANFSLADCTEVQVSVTTTGSQAFAIASFCISGGGLPDIGQTGSPYQYQIVPRNVLTGAQGNPSPVMRYGTSPRRQNVQISLPTVTAALPAFDAQVTIWDVYRYGGSITSYRYIGSGLPNTTFTDQYFDDTAEAGNPVPSQNFEPWPSVDVPFSVSSGGGVSITVTGSQIVVSGFSAWPATISRWLPGTLINLGGQAAYTLRKRPAQLSSTSYLFDIDEVAGSLSPSSFQVNEPSVARQFLPYVFGPDANGFMFAVGDPLRPGVAQACSANTPDQVASTNTVEPCTPSEPLLGGAILDGLAFVASSDRWWALYPAFSFTGTTVTSALFTPFQKTADRGLAAPYGICTDKKAIYFWAKDGIGATTGDGYKSLTDADLYILFPHDDVQGKNITRNGVTFYAPDYSRAATFRLAHINGYLYADYQDSTGTPRTLVCWLAALAWSSDAYANSIISRCAIVQPEGTLTSSPNENYGLAVMADNEGNVYAPSLTAGDNGADIAAVLAPFEWDGEPERKGGLWEDFYLDAIPVSGITATLVEFGQQAIPPTTIAAANARQLQKIDAGDGSGFRYLGLQLNWSDAPGSAFTLLFTWRSFADPDNVYAWSTRALTFGLTGYVHIGRIEAYWSSADEITLNFTAIDGTSPATLTIPASNSNVNKVLLTPTFNKGQLFTLDAVSAEPMQMMGKEFIVWVRQWGSSGPYRPYRIGAEEQVKP